MKRMHSSRIVIQALPAPGGPDYWDDEKSRNGTKLRKLNSKAAVSRRRCDQIIDDFVPWQAKRMRNKQNRRVNALCFHIGNTDHVLEAPLKIMSQENNSHLWSPKIVNSSTQVRSCMSELSPWKVKRRRSKFNALENNVITLVQENATSIPERYHLVKGRSSEMGVDKCYERDLVMSSSEIGTCMPKSICEGAEETNRNSPSKSCATDQDVKTHCNRCTGVSKDHVFVTLDSKSVCEVENQVDKVSNVGHFLTTENCDVVKVSDTAIETRDLPRYPRLEVQITYSRKRRKNFGTPASSLPSSMVDAASPSTIENKKKNTRSCHYEVSLSYCSHNYPEELITRGDTLLMDGQQMLLEKATGDSSCSETWNKNEIIQVDNQNENINSSMASIKDESSIGSKAENIEQEKRNEKDGSVNVAFDIEFAKESTCDASLCDCSCSETWNKKDIIQVDNQNENINSSMASIKGESSIDAKAENIEQENRNEKDGIVNVAYDIEFAKESSHDARSRDLKASNDTDIMVTANEPLNVERQSATEDSSQSRASAIVDGNSQITNLGIIPKAGQSAIKDSLSLSRASAFVDGNTQFTNVGTSPKERQPATEDSSPSRASAFLDGNTHFTDVGIIPPLGRVLNARSSKKLLVLDVNGLLADIVPLHHVPYDVKADIIVSGKAVFKRPFHDDFLDFCFERFNVGVWSSRIKRNMELVLDFLLGNSKQKLLFCWDQSHCTDTGFPVVGRRRSKPIILKKLKKLWDKYETDLPWERGDYDESNTLLLDDSPHKALCNPPYTAVFPNSYHYRDEKDDSLGPEGDLRVYLDGLSMAENVQKYVESNPFGQRPITEKNASWRYYRKVIEAATYFQDSSANKYSTFNCRH